MAAPLPGGQAEMAKKTSKDDETAEDGAEAASKPGKKKLVMIGGALALVAVLGGSWFFLLKKKPVEEISAEAAAAAAKKQITFVEMKDMMIGISAGPQQDRQPIVKIKVALEIADPKTADQVKPLLPRVEDAFQVFMRELRPSDLDGSAGIYRLKEELLRRVNVTVYPAKVDAVLFKELLLQ
ncbi:flagellar basal body-associated protein FliL [Bosea sp. LjRoot237]|uniref:flagellar basal body-associated protein FliL n=1 Tax=Bosea sp. LjRoot237 TaxID=3342292 RepID=UPI003ED16D53